MRGYEVTLRDGTRRSVEAESYHVDDAGALVLLADGAVVERLAVGGWDRVSDAGERLSEEWPPSSLDIVLRNSFYAMARFGSFPPKDRGRFLDWRLNDLDEFVASIVSADGIDASSTTRGERQIVEAVRAAVIKHFDLGR